MSVSKRRKRIQATMKMMRMRIVSDQILNVSLSVSNIFMDDGTHKLR